MEKLLSEIKLQFPFSTVWRSLCDDKVYISILFLVRDLIIVQKFIRELAACGMKSEFVRIVLTSG